MTMRSDKRLNPLVLESDFQKKMRAKAILCKLPIVDMKNNMFSTNPDDRALALRHKLRRNQSSRVTLTKNSS